MSDFKSLDFTSLTKTAAYKSFCRAIRTYQAARIITAVAYTAISLAFVLSPIWINLPFTLLTKSFIIFVMVKDWQDRFGSSPKVTFWAGASWLGLVATMVVGYFVEGRPGLYGIGYCLALVLPWLIVIGWYVNEACDTRTK